jgi:hypothetical protein
MKTTIALCGTAIMLFATVPSRADIIAGPITNPANGHDYYLLSPNTWTMSEAEAESLDGTLAVIKNSKEQEWVFSAFGAYGGTNRNLWIGLHRSFHGGPLVWVTGEKLDYADWAGGQPDDSGGVEDCVFMVSSNRPWGLFPAGTWDDITDSAIIDGSAPNGVVELPGKAHELSLSKAERALIGNWYEGGNIERPCWIVGTDKLLFVISNNRLATRASLSADGTLIAYNFRSGWPIGQGDFGYPFMPPRANLQTEMRGEIMKDKILWSNGTWWSRKPSE